MNIGIIGSGKIGATMARLFVDTGHRVAIANSRGPESLEPLVRELGEAARGVSTEEAARFGDVVLLAIPWRLREGLPAAELFEVRIVVDAMNPYTETGGVADLGDSSSSEEVAKQLPGARLVKAFNTMLWSTLRDRRSEGLVLFVAGDDEKAKRVVSDLIRKIGFEPVDTGSLAAGGRRQQPGTPVYNTPMTRAEAEALAAA